jgi:hypothetical protein
VIEALGQQVAFVMRMTVGNTDPPPRHSRGVSRLR